jgi:hypothetical protein
MLKSALQKELSLHSHGLLARSWGNLDAFENHQFGDSNQLK